MLGTRYEQRYVFWRRRWRFPFWMGEQQILDWLTKRGVHIHGYTISANGSARPVKVERRGLVVLASQSGRKSDWRYPSA